MFLKIINEFHYDHSEKLGDAFEYLLSVLVARAMPDNSVHQDISLTLWCQSFNLKRESICDPACGTAGF